MKILNKNISKYILLWFSWLLNVICIDDVIYIDVVVVENFVELESCVFNFEWWIIFEEWDIEY